MWPFNKPEEPRVIHTNQRRQCWAARDAFFECLEVNHIDDPDANKNKVRSKCPQELREFEKICIASWVEYFKKKRIADMMRDRRIKELELQGYRPINEMVSETKVISSED